MSRYIKKNGVIHFVSDYEYEIMTTHGKTLAEYEKDKAFEMDMQKAIAYGDKTLKIMGEAIAAFERDRQIRALREAGKYIGNFYSDLGIY